MSHLKGHIQVATASVMYGTVGIFIKFLHDMQIGSMIFYRLLFAVAALVFYLWYTGRLKDLRIHEKKGLVLILLLGLFQGMNMLAYFISVTYTTVSIAVLLLYTAPIYVTILSPFILKERNTSRDLWALICSIGGVILIIQPQALTHGMDGMYIVGLVAGLASGMCFAGMIMTSRSLRDSYTGIVQATWALCIATVLFVPYSWAVPSGVLLDKLFILILLGLIPTALSLTLYFSGLVLVRAQNASIIGLLEPLSAVVLSFLILHESMSMTTLLGGGFILLAAFLASGEKPVGMMHE